MAEENVWPALERLHAMKLPSQRRLLRLHEETGFGGDDQGDINLRAALDQELVRISEMEFRAQCDLPASDPQASAVPYFRDLLKDSPPFVQYLNFYLYFSVRFAAGRLFDPCAPRDIHQSDCNETTAALPPPPMCDDGWSNQGVIEEFLRLANGIDLSRPAEEKALRFLDGFTEDGEKSEGQDAFDGEETKFELWLRRLYFGQGQEGYFAEIATGLSQWAQSRYDFYTGLETKSAAKSTWVAEWRQKPWKEGLWTVNNPIAARCALVDFYWLARILRADVSQQGEVRYRDHSWLSLLAARSGTEPNTSDVARTRGKTEMLRQEEVLRSVFGYACDLIQNAVQIADECEDWNAHPEDYAFPPANMNDPGSKDGSWRPEAWREVEDQEHIEIQAHRKERQHKSTPGSDHSDNKMMCPEDKKPSGWSRRVWTGEQVDNLFGLAFSGGGIRSATFNLGVLQRLQELDLLRHVDYLSTVSGGGYVGAWLVGNVRRTRYWLSRMTSWDQSIEHLRRYSNYLAPHNGVLSPDSWSMWITWIRNALLIQVTGFVWLAVMMMVALDFKKIVFEWARDGQHSPTSPPHFVLMGCMLIILFILVFYLSQERSPKNALGRAIFRKGNKLTITAALFAWLGCFLTAGLLWGQAQNAPSDFTTFSGTLKSSLRNWSSFVVLPFFVSIALMACLSVQKQMTKGRLGAAISATIFVPVISYLALCGQLRIFGALLASTHNAQGLTQTNERVDWLAFAIGPSMSMLAIALAVVVFIGLLGRAAPDWTREWWTRYGAWIAMIGAVSLMVMGATIAAPWALLRIGHLNWKSVTGGTAWIGSVIGGLMAGKSSKTGEGGERSKALEIVARVGGFLFIIGASAVGSTIVYLILREALGNDAMSYAQNLQAIIEKPLSNGSIPWMWILPPLTALLGLVFSNRFDLNTFGLNQFYRNRLVRCYLGATRWQPGKRHEHPFTAFDGSDDILVSDLRTVGLGQVETPDPEPAQQNHDAETSIDKTDIISVDEEQPRVEPKKRDDYFCGESFRGPFPIINCTLNLGGSSDLAIHTRQSASFTITPLFGGASRKKVGYAPTLNEKARCFAGGVTLGEAISVSGAAASPNMGYNTSPLVSFMMTLFNVRLGWWFPNPAKSAWYKDRPPSGRYLASELLGLANENRDFVNISDGGHFENLGVYELIRRRVRVIIAADAECDETLTFGSLGNLVRICETDFGAQIDLDVSSIRKEPDTHRSRAHCAIGKITYSNGTHGYLVYIKSSITGDEDIGVAQYRSGHPTFPHESTGNQFYSEDQFEAYRRLGQHITERTFRDAEDEPTAFEVAAKLFDVWAPAGFSTESFLQHATTLDRILDHFRSDLTLKDLFQELTGTGTAIGPLMPNEHAACLELLQLMENVFLDLRLDDFWNHPDNRGWVMLFTGFARSPKFRESWNLNRSTYGIRFEYFCSQRLGLARDRPIMRV